MNKKIKPAGRDTRSIDIEDAYTLDFWAREFNVSKDKLKSAVEIAGNNAQDVKRKLKVRQLH
ncbi:DUF3606 domain-containing protein [Mucilaginibacter sp. BT774]|uniref:DUF3606 domain-containing protein n=1 Tax=Mucilaginibacter sp. BT774 TaxID=3062276 RepID=UPI0026768CE7|nr:DUF3606 domain-containing protein [Mucilaginibacter sp. BT774]MDO3628600.1 DUF3606 domain-containing protein [Mucilaginibacter sp. BT774]